MVKHNLQELKQTVTIPILWQRMSLRGVPGRSCKSPFHKDKNPSFSIYDNGRRWKDFSTGEGGDAIDFIAKAESLSPQEAFKRFLAIAKELGHGGC